MSNPVAIVHDHRLLYLVGFLLVLFYAAVMLLLNRSSGIVKRALSGVTTKSGRKGRGREERGAVMRGIKRT